MSALYFTTDFLAASISSLVACVPSGNLPGRDRVVAGGMGLRGGEGRAPG